MPPAKRFRGDAIKLLAMCPESQPPKSLEQRPCSAKLAHEQPAPSTFPTARPDRHAAARAHVGNLTDQYRAEPRRVELAGTVDLGVGARGSWSPPIDVRTLVRLEVGRHPPSPSSRAIESSAPQGAQMLEDSADEGRLRGRWLASTGNSGAGMRHVA